MKFDPKKPHGTIVNHAWARYEQNGVLFNAAGLSEQEMNEPEEVEEIPEDIVAEPPKEFAIRNARDFLSNILAEGQLPRSSIFKESEANNQDWEAVKTAFSQMGGEKIQRRSVTYWKLKTE